MVPFIRIYQDRLAGLEQFEEFMNNYVDAQQCEIRSQLTSLEEAKDAFESAREKLLKDYVECDELQLRSERKVFQKTYHKLKGFLLDKQGHGEGIRSVANSTMMNTSFGNTQVRLPKIELPTFSGDSTQWLSFKDRFESMVHEVAELSEIMKLQYLLASLKGDAARQFEHVQLVAENYSSTWKALVERFDDAKKLKRDYFKAFLDLQPMAAASAEELTRIVNESRRLVRGMERLKEPVAKWDTPLTSVVRCKIHEDTLMAYEIFAADEEDSFNGLMDFCEKRIRILHNAVKNGPNRIHTKPANEPTTNRADHNWQKKTNPKRTIQSATLVCATQTHKATTRCCVVCQGDHPLGRCAAFEKLSVTERQQIVRTNALCFNCLAKNHRSSFCRASMRCGSCKGRHHTLICTRVDPPLPNREETITATTHVAGEREQMVWLSTAQVIVCSEDGIETVARALLDQGSQSNFISERLVQQLRLRKRRLVKPLSGIGAVAVRAESTVTAIVKSRVAEFEATLNCLVLPKVTADFPFRTRNTEKWNMPTGVTLADPAFFRSERIDLLIGGELFSELLQQGQLRFAPHLPKLLETRLGWIVSGKEVDVSGTSSSSQIVCSCVTEEQNLGILMEKLVSLEAIPEDRIPSSDDQRCENWYQESTRRTAAGRYIVQLPKVSNFRKMLGDSRPVAKRRFDALERRMSRDTSLSEAYKKFMSEYLDLGHMTKVCTFDEEELKEEAPRFYLPHHAVWKVDSTTTKCRVVFDASCKCSTGHSLNDLLLAGPRLQDDIEPILLRFRMKSVAMVADIEKMYRQILVSESDRNLQRILWRESENEPIAVYQLNTVTYGTTCAPYLAIRTLRKIFEDHEEEFPMARAWYEDFYVDDLLSGANSEEEARDIREQVIAMMDRSGFKLRKWASNRASALDGLSSEDMAQLEQMERNLDTKPISTLGLIWEPKTDRLRVRVPCVDESKPATKSHVMGSIAKIYDPLGFVDPIKMVAKLFMQRLWTLKEVDGSMWPWDKELPETMQRQWTGFISQLNALNNVSVPRFANSNMSDELQYHIFCDASERGYGACAYLRCKTDAACITNLLVSKSKVAPLAKRLTIARLELCAALLASKLYEFIRKARLPEAPCFLWTDSMTTWHWITSSHQDWKTFVANRTAKIQRLTEGCQWKHVPGSDNPADLVSRGCEPTALVECRLWWSGPSWLADNEEEWPRKAFTKPQDSTGEEKTTVALVSTEEKSCLDELFSRYSTYSKLRRVVGYCLRFVDNVKKGSTKSRGAIERLSSEEIQRSEKVLCKVAQLSAFPEEMKALRAGREVARKSSLRVCSPWIDEEGIIRVNGRLRNAEVSHSMKYPIVIPKGHMLANLLTHYCHIKHHHAGPQLMLSLLRQDFWIVGARLVVKRVFNRCIRCFRCKPKPTEQPMGDLPKCRVSEARPFAVSGVDYCGPVFLKGSHRRAAPVKAFIAVFVCFVTRAVHLELVSDLSTPAFLAALRRFIARRGMVSELHSDNGTNFKGASNELNKIYELLNSTDHQQSIATWAAEQQIRFRFIPPRAPHFGGLWESAVKSMKRHLLRVLGTSSVSHEDMVTLLAEIESCLNSRPITPLSDNPSDFEVLTPGHFLTGSKLQHLMEVDVKNIPENRLSHWQHVQQRLQHFWKRWHAEYLQQLQIRPKWRGQAQRICPGMMVIIREDNVPPLKWPLARIVDIHPGQDSVVRVVTVRTAESKEYKRPVSRVCVLPIEENER